mmetsp:Transcript_9089/g.24475  ORF Transcript_9089/g.24475 Transcript_9089/m.24475 type:complete len:121 (+) Transcript_9089:2557-2919(+)|eukprot:scaffold59830_cov17-Tisochrysis_lutea.AAC.6
MRSYGHVREAESASPNVGEQWRRSSSAHSWEEEEDDASAHRQTHVCMCLTLKRQPEMAMAAVAGELVWLEPEGRGACARAHGAEDEGAAGLQAAACATEWLMAAFDRTRWGKSRSHGARR